jgi:maltose alpha-D-glucosyltransferase/alpha-amylase
MSGAAEVPGAATDPTAGAAAANPVGSAASWYRDAVIYELHVRSFADSNGEGVGDFRGLIGKLDYLADLGVNALWLLPFYPSPLRDDGYDIADYYRINPSYGDLRTFKRFVTAAHDRGLRVITELVINHTSDAHPWFQRARRAPVGSEHRDFYVWSDTGTEYGDARVIFSDFESSNWSWDPVAGAYYWHRFYHHQPDLNFDNPAVEAAIFEVLDHWLDMGVDGLRLDAVPYLYEREGTNCENLPETHAFLRRLRAHVDEHYEDRMLLAEANQWPEDAAAYFGDGDECHMNFHFPLMPRLFMAVQRENRTPIVDVMEQTPALPEGAQWATFLRNHDELTLEMVTDEERDYMVRAYAEDPRMRVNLGIRRRLAPLLQRDRRKIELMNALLFALPGTPVIYYGDEIGMGDNVYLGDRDGVRTPMQWSPDRNAGFSTANPHQLYLPVIIEPGAHYENLNVEAQLHQPSSLLTWMRQLITLRHQMPVLGRGDIEFLEPDNPHVLAFVRSGEQGPTVLVVANLSRLAQAVELDLAAWIGHTPVEVFGRTRFAPVGEWPYYLTLAPHGFFWFELDPPVAADAPRSTTVSGTWPEVLRTRGFNGALRRWLPTQRWFAAKDETLTGLSVEDVIPLPSHGQEVAVVIARTSFAHGEDQRYLVPLTLLAGDRAASTGRLHPDSVVADVAGEGEAGADEPAAIADAMIDEAGVMAVVSLATSRRSRKGRSRSLRGRPEGRALARILQDAEHSEGPAVNLLGVEQSNSSAIVAGSAIAKLVRRVEPGDSRDVELPRRLRAHGFQHVPAVLGRVELDLGAREESATAAVVHEVVHNDGDMWQWTQDELARLIDDLLATSTEVAELLGARTAEMHLALQETTTEPIPYTLLYQRGLHQALNTEARQTSRMLRRAGLEPLDVDAALAGLDELRRRKLDAQRIDCHGDLHLGQILWTGRDAVIIDFEGEPTRSLSERWIVRNPLVDVAGMIRSFDYAGRVAVATADQRGVVPASEHESVDRFGRTWARRTGEVFWRRYCELLEGNPMLPADPADRDLLLGVFVVSKALYEVRYELANRPDWVAWPLSALDSGIGEPT